MIQSRFFLIPIVIVSLVLTKKTVCAQYKDAGLWLNVSVEKKITSSASIVFNEECRLNENNSQAGTLFSDLGVTHKLNKYFSFSLNYRFIEKRNIDASYSTRHRLYADVTGKYKFRKFTFSLRERIQSQVKDYSSSETGKIPDWYLRSKFNLKYNLKKKITPYLAVELFYQLNNADGNEFDNVRYAAGFEYEFNKRHAIEADYLIQREYHVKNPATDFVTGLGYKFTF